MANGRAGRELKLEIYWIDLMKLEEILCLDKFIITTSAGKLFDCYENQVLGSRNTCAIH